MPHPGHHADINLDVSLGREKAIKNVKYVLRTKRILRSPTPSSEAVFLKQVFHGPLVSTFLQIWDHSLAWEHLPSLLATNKFSTVLAHL